MLAGAYRKEMVYQNQIDANLIPFPYHRLTLTSDLKENKSDRLNKLIILKDRISYS